jgi:hypothetical protein
MYPSGVHALTATRLLPLRPPDSSVRGQPGSSCPAHDPNLRAVASDWLPLAVAVPATLAIAGNQSDGRPGDQRVWVRIVSGWVHPP